MLLLGAVSNCCTCVPSHATFTTHTHCVAVLSSMSAAMLASSRVV
jgi:hypothetical protein